MTAYTVEHETRHTDAVEIGVYDIPAINMARFEREIAALNKHAARLGCPPATVERLGETVRTVPVEWLDPETQTAVSRTARYVYVGVRVTGAMPQLEGWSLAAVLEGTEAGTLVRTVPGMSVPDRYQTADAAYCDHCGKRRARSATFVLVHEDGRTIQVGRQCLKDFLGGLDPQNIAALAQALFGLAAHHGGGGGERVHDSEEYLAYVCAAVRVHGYLSGAQARNGDGAATSGRASHQMRLDAGETARNKWDEHWTATDEDVTAARAILAEARASLAAETGTGNEYLHNLRVLLQLDYVRSKDEGYLASVYGYVKRQRERRAEESREASVERTNGWVGAVGTRETFTLTFMGYRSFQNDWGDRYLNRFETATGDAVQWWTGKDDDFTEGSVYRIKATVKAHDEYKGRRQTVITRASVIEEVAQ